MTHDAPARHHAFLGGPLRGEGVRLLPWPGPSGQPCYLQSDNDSGYLSRLADRTEESQLDAGAELVDLATEMLDDLRTLADRLSHALRDTLRVAVSRGDRLPRPAYQDAVHGDDDGPHLPAEAFG
ncbi:hypothetical protein QCN29_05105 [Streptomyces sp. HNM0663]|uniref:Uncharacterized protein n=1 Tax=Streptomyces chengmaiensis TaxID=3040919 RepID=A0ABT6HHD8_9ACTN|nr:hypothetical protein [Streptomyces chengmaiensis]MDH2388177.1 hypothetical protein [Streptomyces chengmaiensis]